MDVWPGVDTLRLALATLDRGHRALREQRNAMILDMVRAGWTRQRIGDAWGMSNVNVTQVVNAAGGTAEVMASPVGTVDPQQQDRER